ncbi:MAG: YeeE/YedE family protein [Marinosulfonomonas sp.]|nr:YeeE/YedE family protein [Marinosulfonomonas sp.]
MLSDVSEPQLVAAFGLFGGIFLGLAARFGRFCTLGAIEDLLYGSSDTRLRMWVLAIGVAIVGSFALSGAGLLDIGQSIYHSQPWSPTASVLGGLMFGYGMALAGNCGFGALARLGGGDLRSFVIVLVMGLAAYVTLSGPLAVSRLWFTTATTAYSGPTLGYAGLLADISGLPLVIPGVLIGLIIIVAALSSRSFIAERSSVIWAAIVGLTIVSGWAGTAYVSATGFEGTPVVSHTFSAPIGESLLFLMTSSGGGLSFGVGSVAGVLFGAFIGSLIKGHFRWEACEDPRELRRQIVGAAIMGVGAVLALGCTIGQGISAFSLLSFSAPITFASIFLGATFGLRQLISGFGTV